ncbi:MAG: hypothetical protein HY788_00325 [Deltaproteobacteria bacterium]|nr:hypothetical protein [Deltaproteobacteria bacterium]
MTLSHIIQEANRKLETERDELVKVAKAEKYRGTVDEIMEFLDQYDGHFQDTNVQVVKAALETFLRRLSPPALKLTMASMKRQVGIQLGSATQEPSNSASGGGSVISQSDIDALLKGANASEESTSAFEQSEIDALLGEIEELGPQSGKRPSGTPAKKPLERSPQASTDLGDPDLIVDQSAIDALLAGVKEDASAKRTAGTPLVAKKTPGKSVGHESRTTERPFFEEEIVSQTDIDALLSQGMVSKKEIGVEAERALDPSLVEELLAQIQTDAKPEESAVVEDASDLSPETGFPTSEDTNIDQSSIDALFSQEAGSQKALEAEAQAALDQTSVEELLAQIETDAKPEESAVVEDASDLSPETGFSSSEDTNIVQSSIDALFSQEAAPEEKDQLADRDSWLVNGTSGIEEAEALLAPEGGPMQAFPEEEMPAAGEAASPESAEIPMAPDLEAGDVPLEIELPLIEPVPDQQRVVDAIVEATRKKVSQNLPPAGKNQPSPGEHVQGAVVGKEAAFRSQDIGRERILEERGEAKVLDTFYRIYACVNGSYELLSESSSAEETKQKLMTAWMDHAGKDIVIKRVTRKEVLVIKEDLDDVPVRLEVTLDS